MTTKAAFTPEEWTSLIQAPLDVAVLITVASPSVFGSMKEMFAAAEGLQQAGQMVTPPNELMASLYAEYRSQETIKQAQPKFDTKDPVALHQEIYSRINAAAAAVDAKATPEEATAYKQWLYDFGIRQANASKEGGFLGIGAVRVNDKEKAALAELAKTLGVTPSAELAPDAPAADAPAADAPAADAPVAGAPAVPPVDTPVEPPAPA